MNQTGNDPSLSLETQELLNYKDFLHSAMEKLWLIALCMLVALFLGAAWCKRTPPTYLATATLQVEPRDRRIVDIEKSDQPDYGNGELRNTFVSNMTNETLMLKVVKAASLAENPNFLPPPADGHTRSDAELAGNLVGMVHASVRKNTRLLDIAVEHTDPAVAQKLANTIGREFIRQNVERGATSSKVALEFLMDEANSWKSKLENSERALQAYKEKYGSVSFNERRDLVFEKLKDLNGRSQQARSNRMTLEGDYEQLRKLGNNPEALLTIPSVLNHPMIMGTRQAIAGQEADMAILRDRYKDKHPKMIQAQSRLDELKQQLNQTALRMPALIQSELEKARAQEKSIADAAGEQESSVLQFEGKTIDFNVLSRQVDSDRAMYEGLLRRVKETDITKNIETDAIQFVQEANVPGSPFKPDVKKIMIVATFAGLTIAVMLVYILHLLDTAVKTVDQAEKITGLPVLGAVPRIKKKNIKKGKGALLPALDAADSPAAEAFRSLRASIALTLDRAGGPSAARSILFTSAMPGEGKSFCCSNYAVTLAQQGVRTLVIDADLRRPILHRIFFGDKVSSPGLAEYLGGTAEVRSLIRATELKNLSVLPCGMETGHPAELLANGSARLHALAEDLQHEYDFLVFDTAPINILGDTSLIIPHVPTVCLVLSAGRTPRRAVTRALELIRQAKGNVYGTAVNRLPSDDQRSYYYYGYHRYYHEKYGTKAYAGAQG